MPDGTLRELQGFKLAPAKDDDWQDRLLEWAEDVAAALDAHRAIVRELAEVYTVDTDQAALIRLVQRAKEVVRDEHL